MINKSLLKNLINCIILGSIAGSIAFNMSNFEDLTELSVLLNDLIEVGQLNKSHYELMTIFLKNVKYVLAIWFLGFTTMCKSLVYMVNFTKGFSIGYTSSIFLFEYGFKGIQYILINYTTNSIIAIIIIIYISHKSIKFNVKVGNLRTYIKHLIISLVGTLILSLIS